MNISDSSQGPSAAVIDFMEDPDSYAHHPDRVEHIQTHISHVFIAGSYVYKIKKAVNFEFLDFSTLEKRKFYCQREVELNRRLCEDIYLGVIAIARKTADTFILESEDGEDVIEYAVKMKRLEEEYFLTSFIDQGALQLRMMDRVANKLSTFYNKQEPKEDILKWGAIEKVRFNTDENFSQTESFIGKTIDENSFKAIRKYTNRYYDLFSFLFKQRIDEKRIVDGHGDLHLEHIHITPDRVRIYDCIEFNDRFRYGDTAADLAYLAMDLDFTNSRKEERYFLEKMTQKLNDPDLLIHIDFYKCYRAYVKGKVKSMQASEEEVGEEEREKARLKARSYFNLSLRYALLGSRPTVLVFMGRIATGKSTLARSLSSRINIEYCSSDRIRKSLKGLPLDERTDVLQREELYSQSMTKKVYNKLSEKAREYLASQNSVILDATYSKEENRKRLIDQLYTLNMDATFYFIETQAPDELITERLKERERKEGVISDARLDDFEKIDQKYQAPQELSPHNLIEIDTSQSLEGALDELYQKLIKSNLNKVDIALNN
ncbi:AAA family ATPase [Aliifodinibius salicampi]|uniref:AAA family ATPase n=1 Tax=Fodinibius salicampi TaxID=1920655 RepID=A0ABT3PW43_9BACT|nr:bifunctional aminoglycoside phosphotransferase/ATP-binding protein [Fodinibius salicampi]MCW9712021.1 AAA family ATPase [Fodinibius salicampi]